MRGVRQLVRTAKAGIENLTPADLARELATGDVLLVDVREREEAAATGLIEGAVVVPRGVLEFNADVETEEHLAPFDPGRRVILYCASGSRSALAARSLQELGFLDVGHLDGGVASWVAAGRPLVPHGEQQQ